MCKKFFLIIIALVRNKRMKKILANTLLIKGTLPVETNKNEK